MAGSTLRDSLVDEIKDMYNAEKQMTKALPKLAKAATSEELRTALESHLEETHNQVTRLERVFELMDETARGKHCAGMAGIVEEGNDLLEEDFEDAVMDACIIAAAQKSEHYEITSVRHDDRVGRSARAHRRGRASSTRSWRKRRPPTRSCRPWPNPGSTKPLLPASLGRKRKKRRAARRRAPKPTTASDSAGRPCEPGSRPAPVRPGEPPPCQG